MTDQERIVDLERRVDQLEDILERLTGNDDSLWCRVSNKDRPYGYHKVSLSDWIKWHCKFGKKDSKT